MTPRLTPPQRSVYHHPAFAGRITVPRDPHACWDWTAGAVKGGYGRVRWDGKTWWAHRLSRHVAFGDLPEAVCHHCDRPCCVNPEHLRAGTLADNTAEMWAKGRANVLVSLDDARLAIAVEELARTGAPYSRGRRARIELLAARLGVSSRTLYRLMDPGVTPAVYARTLTPTTSQEKAA